MSFASKHNKEKLFNVDTTDMEYMSMGEAFNKYGKNAVYVVGALYINTKGKYDDAPVAAVGADNGEWFMLNLPAHMTDECRDILNDSDDIADINAGKVGLKLYPYHSKQYNRDCFSANWVDM